MGNDNELGLIFRIAADPSQADAALAKLGESAARETDLIAKLNQQLGTSYESLAAASRAAGESARTTIAMYREAGLSAAQAHQEIRAAFGSNALSVPEVLGPNKTESQRQLNRALWESATLNDAQNNLGGADLQAQMAWHQKELSRSVELYKKAAVAAGEASAAEVEGSQRSAAAATEAADAQAASMEKTASATKAAAEPVIAYNEDVWGAASAWREAGAAAEESSGRTFRAVERSNAVQGESVDLIGGLREQYAALAVDAERLQALPFLSGEEATGLAMDRQMMAEIQEEAQGLGATLAEDGSVGQGMSLWHRLNQGVIGDFRMMRYAMYAFTTPMMFSYIIPQIESLISGVKELTLDMQGLDSAGQKALQELIKGSVQAETVFQGLTIAQKIWQGEQLKAQTQARINRDIAASQAIEAQSRLHDVGGMLRDLTGWSTGIYESEALRAFIFGAKQPHHSGVIADMQAKAAAYQDQLQQDVLLTKQEAELAKLEKQQQQQRSKGTHTIMERVSAMAALRESERQFQIQGMLDQLRVGSDFSKAELRQAEGHANASVQYWKNAIGEISAERSWRFSQELQFHRAAMQEQNIAPDEMGRRARAHASNLRDLHAALATHAAFAGENLNPLGQTFGQYGESLKRASEMAGVAIEPISRLHFQFAQLDEAAAHSGISIMAFSQAMGSNIAQALIYENSIGKSMEKAAKATIASVAARAMVMALYETGVGLADLFVNPPAAAAAFESAAVFGSIAGAAAAVAHAIPGGGSHARGAAGAGRGAGAGSAGTQSAPNAVGSPLAAGAQGPHFPGGHVIVEIHGDEETGRWVASRLNTFVNEQGGYLQASHTKTSAPVGQ